MENTTKYLFFTVAIIAGGLMFLHYRNKKQPTESMSDVATGDKTTVNPNDIYTQFYGTGNGTWLPGSDINILLPDQSPAGGAGGGTGEYDIITSMQ